MEADLIRKIKQKKEFSQIPDELVERVLHMSKVRALDSVSKVRETRAILRKVFTAFLTKKVLSGKLDSLEVLERHYSTKFRDYGKLYERILRGEKSIVDLGAGVNGFSFSDMLKFSSRDLRYVGVEAVGQVVEVVNGYFERKGFNALGIHGDLFDIENILRVLKGLRKPRIVFVFSVIDALEAVEMDFSKRFVLEISKECEKLVLSFPTQSLGKRKGFRAKRFWILSFLESNFEILDDFEMSGERFVVFERR